MHDQFDERNRFVIQDYQLKPPFSSFLPGIAGPKGIPAWCYYNNRGQAVCSFGAQDKDHAILEFCPAHIAYRDNARTGFRTFVKAGGRFDELFTGQVDMHIAPSEVEITCRQGPLAASALYFGVPGEPVAALARVLTLTNTTGAPLPLELLDGLPALVPYGVNQDALKNQTQLSKAWMQVEDVDAQRAYFRVRASMADTAQVTTVEGGNFCLAYDGGGNACTLLVQPSLVFGQDTGFARPLGFMAQPLAALCAAPQATQNEFPCCFAPCQAVLAPGETLRLATVYGQAAGKATAAAFAAALEAAGPGWFDAKRAEAAALTDGLCAAIATRTADPVFDGYCKQSYLDNLLRGGAPMFFRDGGRCVPFYLYSRKHGDPEREYNYFSMGAEPYAQGNGNFRDVNQNRRSDVLFAPELGDANVRTFFDLLQLDGYNPLVITACDYTLDAASAAVLAAGLPAAARTEAVDFFAKPFTPGALALRLARWGVADADGFLAKVICTAHSEPNATFQEGYWCDHWTYNLDLIESFLAVYPERKQALLFAPGTCRWYETPVLVNPRAKRYELTENGLRQYHALDEHAKTPAHKWMHTADGQEGRSSLMEKLVLLCTIKTATLDAAGMGVEMEGGKPGWYDALNGLPGLLGSSMAESCELARVLAFTAAALEEQGGTVALYREIAELAAGVDRILAAGGTAFARWQALNDAKEAYRQQTLNGVDGARTVLEAAALAAMLRRFEQAVRQGIGRAVALGGGICPTYFTFTADGVRQTPDGPLPTGLTPAALPLFLEGPVRWLKLDAPIGEKRALAAAVKASPLYDAPLKMYKVNASLEHTSYEVGRCRAFTPGWLENESIWLHMEYKYLLELLKSGLYDEFAADFRTAAVPFLDAGAYGRSPLENVSFLASSANPNPALRGKGFVARLSGSTAEFLQIWQLMFFGPAPFTCRDGAPVLRLDPFLPAYLMPADGTVQATFLGQIPVTYRAVGLAALCPGKTAVRRYTLTTAAGAARTFDGPTLPTDAALAVREGRITAIEAEMEEIV